VLTPRILLLSTSDTDLLSARSSGANYALAAPGRFELDAIPEMVAAADLVVVRILGGRRAWTGLDVVLEQDRPVVVLTGEMVPDPELMEASTVPIGVANEAHGYLAQGGPANLGQLHAFLSDTVLLTGLGFEPPVQLPAWGPLERTASRTDGPVVGLLYYRAHQVSGNTAFVEALSDAIEAKGGTARPFFTASLRTPDPELLQALEGVDVIITTVLAAGGTRPALASAGEDDEAWDVGALAAFDVPVLQALALTSSRETWADGDEGLSPLDTATQVAIPEFDGRIITVPFSFKEVDEDGLSVYVPDTERCLRVAGLAVSHGRLRHLRNADKRIGVVLSAYPTKHSRIGNAVGLDTPASVVRLLKAMDEAGYDVGDFPGYAAQDGDALVHALIAAGGQDPDWLTEEQLQGNPIRIPAAAYRSWFATLPVDFQEGVEKSWGPAPGDLYVDRSQDPDGEIVVAALQSGNITLVVQPPRGFGANPVAIYHDPDLPPSHHYLAAYQWLASSFKANALVHVGKHGNLEWLPGKALGMSASCGTDAALGDLPLVYPFLVNDPGEGSQAKRRAHATLVDHLVPPMARAESYGDLASPASSSCSTSTPTSRRWTPPSCPPSARRSGPSSRPRALTTISACPMPQTGRTTPSSTTSCCTSTAGCARSRTSRSATASTSWGRRRRVRRVRSSCWRSCGRGSCGPASGRSPACARPSASRTRRLAEQRSPAPTGSRSRPRRSSSTSRPTTGTRLGSRR
jgi:cobaltochelatase CobN